LGRGWLCGGAREEGGGEPLQQRQHSLRALGDLTEGTSTSRHQ
jgi:hypothetical protein